MAALLALGLLIIAAPALAQLKPAGPAEMISQFRQQHHESRVTMDPTLNQIARAQADAMAAKAVLDHEVLGSFPSRVAPARAGAAAENIAYGYASFPKTLQQWINSPGHRSNLLLHDASRIGVASAKSANGQTYWAMVIAGAYDRGKKRQSQPSVAKPAKGAQKGSAKGSTKGSTKGSKPRHKPDCHIKLLGLCM
ncbi:MULTISPECIES: CAP domain-containing protein [Rhodopseudomonas]|nr:MULTISPECIES: CAP domain-containing protein [Rhodopseudomonas]MDF3809246.1 CAP domain-containing protein [Rhodopseudomonas sp. BAL398]WOK19069.1 CAP domain-containing protein [Rhodopseudomonas sp. BAL398]